MCTCDLISLVNLHSMLVWLHLSILQTGLNLDLMYNHFHSDSVHGIAAIVLSSSGQSHCGIHVAMILVVVSLIVVFMLL